MNATHKHQKQGGGEGMLKSAIRAATARALRTPFVFRIAGMIACEYTRASNRRASIRATKAFGEDSPPRVLHGPFAGMAYSLPASRRRALVWGRTIIGSFEAELHAVVEDQCRTSPRVIVNIGASEGYYAVGLAYRIPGVDVIAFEAVPSAAERCVALARLNGVSDRVEMRGTCDREQLAELDLRDSFIVCDCEGAEHTILDPERVTGLAASDILVEVHETSASGASAMAALAARFDATHVITQISPRPRDHNDYPELAPFPPGERDAILDEGRSNSVGWLLLKARS